MERLLGFFGDDLMTNDLLAVDAIAKISRDLLIPAIKKGK